MAAGQGKTGGEVALVEPSQYPVLSGEDAELMELVEENLGDDGISPFDLERIKIPAGGGTTWEVPTLDGDEAAKEIEGIVVAWQKPRVFWQVSLDDSDEATPPDCSSDDGEVGNGMYGIGSDAHPSGVCATCPMNQWGSAGGGEGKGKACKETRLLFLLMPNSVMPVTVSLPPTSIQPLKKYFFRLANNRLPYYGITTRLSLEKVSAGGGINYAVVKVSGGSRLSPEMRAAAKEFGRKVSQVQRGAADVAAAEYRANAEAEAAEAP